METCFNNTMLDEKRERFSNMKTIRMNSSMHTNGEGKEELSNILGNLQKQSFNVDVGLRTAVYEVCITLKVNFYGNR